MNMFRSGPPEPVEADEVGTRTPADLVPLSHLALDLGGVPDEGWPMFLGRRAMRFVGDDLGRDSVTRHDARLLLDEAREVELKRRNLLALREQEAIEADELRRSQIYRGISADQVPVGVNPAAAMLQAARDAQPRRQSLLEAAFDGGSMTFHELPKEAS